MADKETAPEGAEGPQPQPSTPAPSTQKEETTAPPKPEYPTKGKLWLIMFSLYISIFLIALDKTILATAVPRITDEFNSLSDIGWYISAYMLTQCSFQLLWGRIYTFYPPKAVFLAAILVFEIGSAVCGATPSSIGLIFGRAIAGLGSAGMMNGAIIIMVYAVPLEKRPMFQGLIVGVFGIASVVGPLLGGVFTESVSWRWCFYINLPCGAVAVSILVLFLHLPERKETRPPLYEQFKRLDPLGVLCLLPSIVCLLIALQWGGTTYAWSSWRIILLLVISGVLFVIWLGIQIWMPETATVPTRILKQRTIIAGFVYAIATYSAMIVTTYYIPLFFQALKNFSPISSGLATLPSIMGLVIGGIVAGGLVQKFGMPAPFMLASTILSSVGIGLITTWQISVPHSRWIGYQFMLGFGIGLGMQQPNMLAQIVLPKPDVPTGLSLMVFGQNFGSAVFISVAQNIFADDLAGRLSSIPDLGLDRKTIVNLGATQIRKMVPADLLGRVLADYRLAVQRSFYLGLGLACAGLVGIVIVEWRRSIKEGEKTGEEDKKVEKTAEEEMV